MVDIFVFSFIFYFLFFSFLLFFPPCSPPVFAGSKSSGGKFSPVLGQQCVGTGREAGQGAGEDGTQAKLMF